MIDQTQTLLESSSSQNIPDQYQEELGQAFSLLASHSMDMRLVHHEDSPFSLGRCMWEFPVSRTIGNIT